ncbi:uncharacterized protein CLUP02_01081 [Colletotrichum lupini]|uniref:Uncharacterized protein n=1 Tax=Colletotrichum lupini TaxID=145971 RepID=A0A9Q8SC17_9PEZI|nr:uncharacterized protein CLUP02_01081 [Colletotrichum lupini]UQC74430.1 hypothetical protein CLUP02_01081 [Colletotrichum lupini]
MSQLGDCNDLGEDIIPADIEGPELSRLKVDGIDVPMARLGGLDLNYKICQIEEDLSALRETSAEISRTETDMANFLAESYEHRWCHATGSWMHLGETPDDEHAQPLPQRYAAANIVPYSSNVPHEILDHLFRERTGELSGPANSLLLSTLIQYWFNHYKLVKKPLKRWKIDILDKGIEGGLPSRRNSHAWWG